MIKAAPLLLLAALGWSAAAPAQEAAPDVGASLRDAAAESHSCKSNDPVEVVVCGRSKQQYRIDPQVLAAARGAEAVPPKPELDATRQTACTGPNCGGGTIPLIGMALTALKAAELAAEGDDWREAFRTHPDQYQAYEQARASKKARVSIGIGAGNK